MKICDPCPCLLKENFTSSWSLSYSLLEIKVLGLGAVNADDTLWWLALRCALWCLYSVASRDSSQNLVKDMPQNQWQLNIFVVKELMIFLVHKWAIGALHREKDCDSVTDNCLKFNAVPLKMSVSFHSFAVVEDKMLCVCVYMCTSMQVCTYVDARIQLAYAGWPARLQDSPLCLPSIESLRSSCKHDKCFTSWAIPKPLSKIWKYCLSIIVFKFQTTYCLVSVMK